MMHPCCGCQVHMPYPTLPCPAYPALPCPTLPSPTQPHPTQKAYLAHLRVRADLRLRAGAVEEF